MDATQTVAVWALGYAAVVSIFRNLFGEGFMQDWSIVILVVWTFPFLWWLNRRKSGAS